jgi:hypothetical protein
MYKNLCIFLPVLALSFIVPIESFSQVASMRSLERGQAASLIQDLIIEQGKYQKLIYLENMNGISPQKKFIHVAFGWTIVAIWSLGLRSKTFYTFWT